jgi:hypothetical protein
VIGSAKWTLPIVQVRLSPNAARACFVLDVSAMSNHLMALRRRAADTTAKYVPLLIKGVEGDAAGVIMIAEMLMLEALTRLHANAKR